METGTRDDVQLDLFRVDSRPDAEMSLSEVRDGKVAKGWRVRRFHIGDEGYLFKFRNGERFALHFRKQAIVALFLSLPLLALEGWFFKNLKL